MTDLQALLEAHQSTRLLRLSFPKNDGPQAKLMVNRSEGTEYLSRDFEFEVEILKNDAGIALEAFTGYVASFKLVKTEWPSRPLTGAAAVKVDALAQAAVQAVSAAHALKKGGAQALLEPAGHAALANVAGKLEVPPSILKKSIV